MKTAWLLRALSTERALTLVDLQRMSGWSERTLQKGLAELRERDEVLTLEQSDPDHGTLPTVHIKTYDVNRMRVNNNVLRARAAPKQATERTRAVRRRNRYIASMIKKRQERERREWAAEDHP